MHEPTNDRLTMTLRGTLAALVLFVTIFSMTWAITGCASMPEYQGVAWYGEGGVDVSLDAGHAATSVAYVGFQDGDETVSCPVVELDLRIDIGGFTLDVLLEGVPPSVEGAEVDKRCYEKFETFGPKAREAVGVSAVLDAVRGILDFSRRIVDMLFGAGIGPAHEVPV